MSKRIMVKNIVCLVFICLFLLICATAAATEYSIITFSESYGGSKLLADGEIITGQAGLIIVSTPDSDDKMYCIDQEGTLLSGWQNFDQKTYYFGNYFGDNYRAFFNGFFSIDGKNYVFGADGALLSNTLLIEPNSNNIYYIQKDGTPLTGWKTIDQKAYYFGDCYIAYYDGIYSIDNKDYVFGSDGALLRDTLWIDPESHNTYYVQSDGTLLLGWKTVNQKTYYFGYPEYYPDIECPWYERRARTGKQDIDGKTYVFGTDGVLLRNQWLKDMTQEEWKALGFDYNPEFGPHIYYVGEDGSLVSGWQEIDGKFYLFYANGSLWEHKGVIAAEKHVIGDGFTAVTEPGWYYLEDGYEGSYYPKEGWLYIQEDGTLYNGWMQIGEDWYLCNPFLCISSVDCERNMDPYNSGIMDKHVYYCFDYTGKWFDTITEEQMGKPMWIPCNGSYVYHDAYRIAFATGWKNIDGLWYYFDQKTCLMSTGWLENNGKWYFLNDRGTMQTGWLQSGNSWYYFNSNGEMVTGWVNDGGTFYYMNSNGSMATGWIEDNGTWYFMSDNGTMHTGWLQSGNTWYYLKSNGAMATGWENVESVWYYFKDSGAMAANEWIEDKKAEAKLPQNQKRSLWYWFDSNGKMATGWKEIAGKWEMFADSGEWLYTWEGQ